MSPARFYQLRRIVMAGALAGTFLGVSGCASIKDHRGYFADTGMVESVLPGVDNQESIEKSLGRPTFVSQFGQPVWFYVSMTTAQRPFQRPRVERAQITRITFDPKGNVAHIETRGTEDVVRLNPDGGKTPTLGRERSFIQDLFGNIGTVGAGGGPTQTGSGPGPNGS